MALNDARQFRSLKASKPKAEKKVANKPKVIKPGAHKQPSNNMERYSKAKKLKGRAQMDAMANILAEQLGD